VESREKLNILLVNDRPEQLLAWDSVLASPQHNLVHAHSGADALRCILRQDFAVILLDVNMPEMDGFETASVIRLRPRSADIPIIFVTAMSNDELDQDRGRSLGTVDYICSPIEPAVLRAKVGRLVDQHRQTLPPQR